MKTGTQLQKDVMDEVKWESSITAAQFGVTARDGVVTLPRVAASYAEKWAAERAAQRVEGVQGLAEEITVNPSGVHAADAIFLAAAAVDEAEAAIREAAIAHLDADTAQTAARTA